MKINEEDYDKLEYVDKLLINSYLAVKTQYSLCCFIISFISASFGMHNLFIGNSLVSLLFVLFSIYYLSVGIKFYKEANKKIENKYFKIELKSPNKSKRKVR